MIEMEKWSAEYEKALKEFRNEHRPEKGFEGTFDHISWAKHIEKKFDELHGIQSPKLKTPE